MTLEGLWTDRRYTLEQIERLLVTAGTTTAEAKPIEPLPILIDQGGRNALLFREACRLRRMGWGAGEILGALVRVNQRRCRPPLDHAELRGIAVSASRHDPAEDLFPATETGTAEFLETVAADTICFDHGRRGWYVFDGQHWTADTTEEIDRIALAAIRARQAIAVKLDAEAPGRADRIRWMVGSESRVRRDNIVRLAAKQSRLATSGDHWDTDRMLFGVANGNVDLRTGTLRPGQPSDRVTKVAPVVFDPDATCPRWERFLAEVFADDPDLPPYLQRVLGYALTGETSEQVFWILWGLGANGKSTLVEVLMTSVWGNAYAWTMPFPSASWSQSMTEYQKASLVGQRLVAASEVTKRGHLNDELIKSLTGGDTINARHPYGRPFHFAPMAKIFLRVNDKPVIRDQSHGMWRRVKLVPFTQMFKVDTSLMPTLLSEAPGILAWAVRGSVDWQRDGLRHPASVTAATADYQAESDVLSDFFAERCVIEASASVVGRDLFAAFCSWCDARQLPDVDRLSQTAFGLRIRARFPAVEGRQVRYRGIGLRLNAEFAFRTREVEF